MRGSGRFKLFADLAAERTLAAERNGRKILVEVKCFSGRSYIKELQHYLLAHGVPPQDIVLGFQPPLIRPLTEFAVA